MNTLKRNIQYDLSRSIMKKSYFLKIFLIALVCLLSHADVLRALYMNYNLNGYDIIGIYNFTIHFDRFKIVLLVIIASIYTNSFCIDYNSRSLKYILARSKIKIYIAAKSIAILISAVVAYLIGLSIALFILSFKVPWVEKISPFYPASTYFSFETLPPQEHPFLWISLTSILFVVSLVGLCMIGFYISLYWTDSLITICVPAILYFSAASLTALMPTLFFMPGYGNNIKIISDNLWLNYGFKLVINIACIILFTILSYYKLRRSSREGTI